MNSQLTFSDQIRSISMGWLWGITFVIVMLTLGVMDPIGIATNLLENQGVGDAESLALLFVAVYTFPLTFGIFLVALWTITGFFSKKESLEIIVIISVTFLITGIISRLFGLGVSPAFGTTWPGGHWITALPIYVFLPYISTYSPPLIICALVIGTTAAIQTDRWRSSFA